MGPKLLVLGGSTEASALARAMAAAGVAGEISYAGRVARPAAQPIPQRVGGFGGVEGLVAYLRAGGFTHLIDATHPFAARMSLNALAAARDAALPHAALTRPAWTPETGDRWQHVADIASAAAALPHGAERVFLALGRMHLDAFAHRGEHHYLLRLIDPPQAALPLPDHAIVLDRGPFTLEGDLALMRAHRIDRLVCKNAGGTAARAKLDAARALQVPVLMIDRPALPDRLTFTRPDQVIDWASSA